MIQACRPVLLLLALTLGVLSGCSSTGGNKVYKTGLAQANDGKNDAAMETFKKGLATHPGHVRMRFELARLEYEKGEQHHLQELRANRKAADFRERGKGKEAQSRQREANEHRAKATPYYRRARDHLQIVVDDEDDDRRAGWGFFLLMRVHLFFEDWTEAYDAIEQAIVLGKPTGAKLAQMREYQAGLRQKVGPGPR